MKHRNEDAYYNEEVRDGQVVRVPLAMMDAQQRSIAFDATLHQPGYRIRPADAASHDAAAARLEYVARLQDAWKSPAQRAKVTPDRDLSVTDKSTYADADRERLAAYDAMCRTMSEAWRPKMRDQEPDEDDPDAANEVQRELEQTLGRDPNIDDLARAVEARRRRQHADYSQRLSEAWKTR